MLVITRRHNLHRDNASGFGLRVFQLRVSSLLTPPGWSRDVCQVYLLPPPFSNYERFYREVSTVPSPSQDLMI